MSRLGTLRAVISLCDLSTILCEETPHYAGESFPKQETDSAPCTVLEVLPDEEEPDRRAGFYLLDKQPSQFEDGLRTFCKVAGSRM
jgi:hypothetical protein